MRRALVAYCAAEKRPDPGLLPAIERYASDRIRAGERRAADEGAVFLILSGRFGLLAPDDPIPWYDHRLAADEADAMAAVVAEGLRARGVESAVFLADEARPDLAPYVRAMREGCRRAGVPLRIEAPG